MTISDHIAKVRQLDAEATKGPLFIDPYPIPNELALCDKDCVVLVTSTNDLSCDMKAQKADQLADLQFFKHSRTALPAFADALEEAVKLISERMHEFGCRFVNPDYLSTEEINEGAYRCTCWKGKALAAIESKLKGAE